MSTPKPLTIAQMHLIDSIVDQMHDALDPDGDPRLYLLALNRFLFDTQAYIRRLQAAQRGDAAHHLLMTSVALRNIQEGLEGALKCPVRRAPRRKEA